VDPDKPGLFGSPGLLTWGTTGDKGDEGPRLSWLLASIAESLGLS